MVARFGPWMQEACDIFAWGPPLQLVLMEGFASVIAPILSYFRPSSGPIICHFNHALRSDPA